MKTKLIAGITALLMTASCSGYTAAAQGSENNGISIEIDRITLTLDELAALDHTVPVYVRVTENAGFDAAEFGVRIDERCSFDKDIKWLDYDDGYASIGQDLIWRVLANHETWYDTGTILKVELTVPEDAQIGDVYTVSYCDAEYKPHVWSSLDAETDHAASGNVTWTDGYVEIIETPEDTGFVLGEDDWSFLNSAQAFGTSYYKMNSNYLKKLKESLNPIERERVDAMLFNSWGGACYGMAVTSLLAHNDIMNPAQWQVGAHTLHDISSPPSEEILSLIHYYCALQKTDLIQGMQTDYVYLRTEEEKLRILMDCMAKDSPALLTYVDYTWGAHAVVAYDLISGHFVHDGKVYNQKALLYDSNYDGLQDDCCLYFSTDTWEWTIPSYGLHSGKSYLGIVTDDIDLLNRGGYLDGSEYISPDPYISILTSSPISSEFTISQTDDAGNPAPPETLHSEVPGSGIRAFASLAGANHVQEVCFALPEPDSGYLMQLETPDSLALVMNYEDCLLRLSADKAVSAAFDPAGRITMEGVQTDYEMKILYSEEVCADDNYLHIEGQNASHAELERVDAGYLLTADDLRMLSVNLRSGETDEALGFSVQADSVLLHRTEDGMLIASIDTDGDGSFEKSIARSTDMLTGDLTLDGALSISDVIALSQNLLCGKKLSTIQKQLADHDGDGIPTAADQLALLHDVLQ